VAVSAAIITLDRSRVRVGFPGLVDAIEKLVAGAITDPSVHLIGVNGVFAARAQLGTGLLLPVGGETPDVAKRGDAVAPVVAQQVECSAGIDSGQLNPIVGQPRPRRCRSPPPAVRPCRTKPRSTIPTAHPGRSPS
jgi:hypothetical protein